MILICQLVENVVVAVGPMFPLLLAEKQPEYATRTVTILLNMYRRNQVTSMYPVTQCLASILQAAPSTALEPLFDQLVATLGAMVCILSVFCLNKYKKFKNKLCLNIIICFVIRRLGRLIPLLLVLILFINSTRTT